MIKGFEKLELMRKQLEEKGAFEQFDKNQQAQEFEQTITIEMKKQALKERMEEREEEPFLEMTTSQNILTDKQAIELGKYFTKKELIQLIEKKFPHIDTKMAIKKLIIKMSAEGFIPKIPVRIINCNTCGQEIEIEKIDMIKYWEIKDKGMTCKECKKEQKEKDKPIKQVNLIGQG